MSAKSLAELSEIVGGRVVGCPETKIDAVLPLMDAVAGCLTLAEADQPVETVQDSAASAIVAQAEFAGCMKPQIVVEDPHQAFQRLIQVFRPAQPSDWEGVHFTANIGPNTTLGEGTSVGPGVNVGAQCKLGKRCKIHAGVQIMSGCVLGDDCTIFPNAVLHDHTRLGDRTTVQAGAILGAFGFGYKTHDGTHRRAAQLGWVEIGDDVEIGANTTIDRGTYGPTKVGSGTKIDNLVQIGHNCHIGQHNLICAQVGIAGSCTTGDYVVLAGQAGLADHLRLADRSVVGAQAGVMRNLEPDEVVVGSPAVPRKLAMQIFAGEAKLPEMRRELRKLQREFARLQHMLDEADQSGLEHSDAA